MGYSAYIIFSERAGRYYVGSSANPEQRLHYHNTIEKGFTSRYRPWSLVYTKEYPTKQVAQAAERKIKSWKSKQIIERVIRGEVQL